MLRDKLLHGVPALLHDVSFLTTASYGDRNASSLVAATPRCEHRRRTDMKAVRLHEPVGIPGLRYEDAPDPVPAIGDVLVKVHASGITPTELDWPLWTDQLGHKRDYIVPAHEFSGEVVALAWGTAGLSVGEEVFG